MSLPLHPLAVLAVFAALLFPLKVNAQFTFASDSSTNSAYGDGWATGDNGGSGFASWTLASGGGTGGFGGNFIGDPNAAGISGLGTSAFGQFANPTGSGAFANADRSLTSAMQVGDTFSLQWAINFDSGTGGNKGFSLYTGGVAGTQLINVNNGSSAAITINGVDTTFAYGTSVMTWTFAYTGATTLVVTANDRDGSGTYSNSFTVTGALDAFRFYSSSMQSGNQAQPYFNNFSLTNSGLYNVAAAQTEARFLTGSGNLAKTGNGTLTISGTTNNFTGTVGITNGAIRATASSALGSAGSVTVQSGAALEYSGGITVARNLTLNGNGISTGGALRNISGDNTQSGGITLGSASRIASDAGTLTVSGNVSGSGLGLTVGGAGNTAIQTAIGIGTGRLTKEDAGTLTLSGANSYTGGTLLSGGRVVGDTRSLQGAITNNAAVTFHQTTNGSYTGLMSGAGGSLTKSGAGTVTFTANNSYTGATTVSGGRLIVNGSQGSSAVTVSSGASLGGSGTVGGLTVSGLVAPGNSIGTLSAGNTVFNGGGSFELEIFDWVNTAGTGWDLLAVTGNLTLSNTSGSPFTINLVSLQNSSTPGLSTDWNQNANFTNTFITYSGSLLGTSFATNLFTVNTNGFQNAINGTFSITNVTGGLALLYTTSFAPSSTYTWNAGSGLWGTAGNWTNGIAPTNGASIIFSGAGGASTNSSTVSSIQGLVFSNTAGAYTISGSALAVGAGGISNASTAAQTISNNLSLSAPASITAAGGNVTLAGNLTNAGNAVTVGGAANTTIGGVVSGSGALIKSGAGSLALSGANTYTGATTISAGTVVAENNSALGATNGSTTVASGATLELSGGITSAESITITGSGVGNGGAIRSLGDGENTISGSITLGGNARINVDAPLGSVSTLASLGSSSFAVSSEFSFIPYAQTSTNLTLTAANSGDTLAGQFGTIYDWSSVSSFGLRMSVAGTNPELPFEIVFYDGAFSELKRYEATTEGLSNTTSIKALTLLTSTSDLSAVEWLEFKWNGSVTGAISVSLFDVVSVPTSGLLVSGNINGGANVLTVGSATGSSGTVADGMRLTGVISGSGGTYSSTATSLVKDGGGTVYLSGNNTFTGDVRILDGILNVVFGASTNSLGVGSDLFVSSLGTLQVDSNVTVSSFQGAGVGDAGGVQLTGGSFLTVNGAGKTMTMAGDITGFGGLRVAGNSSTLVTLTGDNTYSQATTITAGTLALAGTGGDQALRSTSGISIGSSGKLLLSTSDQVRDNAAITLSGGTIQRTGGVSEVFGNLNLTTASFIDFGTGATGTLRFGTYTPSSLLTVQNFLPGNKLQFGTTLTEGQLNNPTLFAFSNGFTTGTEGGFFTITAIPEPSTYVAAAGLLAMFLWPVRRRLIKDTKSILGLRPNGRDRIESYRNA